MANRIVVLSYNKAMVKTQNEIIVKEKYRSDNR